MHVNGHLYKPVADIVNKSGSLHVIKQQYTSICTYNLGTYKHSIKEFLQLITINGYILNIVQCTDIVYGLIREFTDT